MKWIKYFLELFQEFKEKIFLKRSGSAHDYWAEPDHRASMWRGDQMTSGTVQLQEEAGFYENAGRPYSDGSTHIFSVDPSESRQFSLSEANLRCYDAASPVVWLQYILDSETLFCNVLQRFATFCAPFWTTVGNEHAEFEFLKCGRLAIGDGSVPWHMPWHRNRPWNLLSQRVYFREKSSRKAQL